jgi:hypothetical protein
MNPRSLSKPSYVLVLLLGVLALVDAGNALTTMQNTPTIANFSSTSGSTNAGWVVDLLTSGVSAVLVALLLMRPHLYVFVPMVGWALLALLANFIMRHTPGIDWLATVRMTLYFVILVIGSVVVAFEGRDWLEVTIARRRTTPTPQQ